jgi:hypothetical protein
MLPKIYVRRTEMTASTLSDRAFITQAREPLVPAGECERVVFSIHTGARFSTSNLVGSSHPELTVVEPTWFVEEEEIEAWVRAAMLRVESDTLEEGDIVLHVPGAPGAWIDAPTKEEAFEALPAVLFDWAVMKLGHGDIPVFDGIDLNRR